MSVYFLAVEIQTTKEKTDENVEFFIYVAISFDSVLVAMTFSSRDLNMP